MSANTNWFKSFRGGDTDELLAANKNAFVLLFVTASRARRTSAFNRHNLSPGEALVGDFKRYGLTQQEYRTAKKFLEKHGFATFKATSKGTIASILNSRVFDINEESTNDQGNEHLTSEQRAANEQLTTNKNVKKEKNEKKGNGESGKPDAATGLVGAVTSLPPEAVFWNANRGALSEVLNVNGPRLRSLEARRRDPFWVENYEAAVKRMAGSDFCGGKNQRGWRANFDFLLQPDSVVKTLEGKYDNNDTSHINGAVAINGQPKKGEFEQW